MSNCKLSSAKMGLKGLSAKDMLNLAEWLNGQAAEVEDSNPISEEDLDSLGELYKDTLGSETVYIELTVKVPVVVIIDSYADGETSVEIDLDDDVYDIINRMDLRNRPGIKGIISQYERAGRKFSEKVLKIADKYEIPDWEVRDTVARQGF